MAEDVLKSDYVTKDSVRHDGKDVEIGGVIQLTDKQAEQLFELGVIEKGPAKGAGKKPTNALGTAPAKEAGNKTPSKKAKVPS